MEPWTRRKFFLTSLASSIAAGSGALLARALLADAAALPSAPAPGKRPIIISSANGLHALGKGMDPRTAPVPSPRCPESKTRRGWRRR